MIVAELLDALAQLDPSTEVIVETEVASTYMHIGAVLGPTVGGDHGRLARAACLVLDGEVLEEPPS